MLVFVLTVDQVGSRSGPDRVAAVEADRDRWARPGVLLGPDRTAGDEFQLVVERADVALDAVLSLDREGGWSIGIGVGGVRSPLPATTREAQGPAFSAARAAVEQAKRTAHRAVVAAEDERGAADLTALLQLLLEVRSRRSAEGWAVADLLDEGLTQVEAAAHEGVSPQAVSQRARAAGVRLERDAVPALVRLLARLDEDVAPAL